MSRIVLSIAAAVALFVQPAQAADAPDRGRVQALAEKRFEPDEFRVTQDAVYLHCPNGYGRSKLSNAFFEKHLGVAATTRNWRTVTTLAEPVDT